MEHLWATAFVGRQKVTWLDMWCNQLFSSISFLKLSFVYVVNILCVVDSSHVKIGKSKQQSKGLLFKDLLSK